MTLTFDLLTLEVVSESRVTWAISVPILVFLGLSVLDRQTTDVRQKHRLMPQPIKGGGIINIDDMKNRFDTISALDRRTEIPYQYHALECMYGPFNSSCKFVIVNILR